MASLVLGAVGTAIGAGFGGTVVFGMSMATIGGMIGSTIGSVVDSAIIAGMMPGQHSEGARLDSLRITSSTESLAIPRVYGRVRIGGNVIWATDFREEATTTKLGRTGLFGRHITSTTYKYFASFAVAVCEGPITGIGRIWVDSKPMDLQGVTWRWYPGDEEQMPDPFIAAAMGPDATPAYRGTAYVVFEDLDLESYGNRLPQITFEVFRALPDPESAEGLIKAVTLIPATGEYAYSTAVYRRFAAPPQSAPPGWEWVAWMSYLMQIGQTPETVGVNANLTTTSPDFIESLNQLQASLPAVESVSLVAAWFGDDLSALSCQIRPKVETALPGYDRQWTVDGIDYASARLVSETDGKSAYGGTPADWSVAEAIGELKERGLRVTFYPFLMMDIPAGNLLMNPYSDFGLALGQPAHPWRGRITCWPAPGYPGTVDKTALANSSVVSFFGAAQPEHFSVSGGAVTWIGPVDDWGYRRFILHYAHLCAAAGGVDAFLIGSELRGLTRIRGADNSYPAVEALRSLAAAVRAILGPGTKISYAADWSEYFGHQPDDGSGDVFFHLDPLWSDPNIDFVGIDNYMPISDWRDGFDHLDARAGHAAVHDRAYLRANIAGGEGFDWYYASESDRTQQIRTPIIDGAAGKHWVFRYKDLHGWWSNPHFDRPGGVESHSPTAWLPESKPIRFTELGCAAIDRGANQPNLFIDPKSSESSAPHFSRGWRDDAMQRAYLEASYLHWSDPAQNPLSGVYGGRMVDVAECAAWTWDARPFPAFPAQTDLWTDGENWRLGHWLNGRMGSVSVAAFVRDQCLRAGLKPEQIDVSGLWGAVEGVVLANIDSPRSAIASMMRHFGFDAVESQGKLRFVMRGRAPVARIGKAGMAVDGEGLDWVEGAAPLDWFEGSEPLDWGPSPGGGRLLQGELVASEGEGAEPFELTRGQETELPQALKWQVARSDGDYDMIGVEARRSTVEGARVASETFSFAVPPEEAERRARRALTETWAGRETATFVLPPSLLALDPCDVVVLEHDGRDLEYRLARLADSTVRAAEAVRQDRLAYDVPPGGARAANVRRPLVFGPPQVMFLDLPNLHEDATDYQPLIAVDARPWPGSLSLYSSPASDGWTLAATVFARARSGRLLQPLEAGPVGIYDRRNAIEVELRNGALVSVTEAELLGGANLFAVESATDVWEVVQAGHAELIGPRQYRLTKLLRAQRGTDWAMGKPAPAGARFLVLDSSLAQVPVTRSEIGLARNWRAGPAQKPVLDESYSQRPFTPQGLGLRPFSPCHLRAALVDGAVHLTWIRRARQLEADNWEGYEVALGEDSEAYILRIYAGETVKRSLSVPTPAAVYTAAQQAADFGAPLAPGAQITFDVQQISSAGAGWPGKATITL